MVTLFMKSLDVPSFLNAKLVPLEARPSAIRFWSLTHNESVGVSRMPGESLVIDFYVEIQSGMPILSP